MRLLVCLTAFVALTSAVRVDDKKGFKFCSGPQLAQVLRVDVHGPACPRWPCKLVAGRRGIFQITLNQHTGYPIERIRSDVHAMVRINPLLGVQRVGLPGETKKPACPFTIPRCPFYPNIPVVISKSITVPRQAKVVRGPMNVEFKISDDYGRTLACFTAVVLVG